MNRKFFLCALMLAAVLMLTVSAACAWSCPNCSTENAYNFCAQCGTKRPPEKCECGFELIDSYRFCPNCGRDLNGTAAVTAKPTKTPTPKPTKTPTPKPTKTPTPKPTKTPTPKPTASISITSVKRNGDGTCTVKWTGTRTSTPYKVYYAQKTAYSYTSETLQDNYTGRWHAVDSSDNKFYGTSATVDRLIPGQAYWIIVEDANGTQDIYEYTPGKAPGFPDFPTDLSIQLKSRTGSSYKEHTSFSASEIARSSNTEYGAYIRLDYSMLAREREYLGHVAITAPNGAVITDGLVDIFLPRGRSYSYFSFYSLDDFFEIMIDQFGEVPTGTYEWSLYYDGMYINTTTFRVSR